MRAGPPAGGGGAHGPDAPVMRMRPAAGAWALCLAILLLLPALGSTEAQSRAGPALVEWPLTMAAEAAAAAGKGAGRVRGQAANGPDEKAGYFTVQESRRMFYYYFGARNATTGAALPNAPLLIWLNGGPGCSSLFGLFFENGPYTINSKGQAVANPVNWATAANMLYIDQPVNTGLSYSTKEGDSVTSEAEVAKTMIAFLDAFYAANPALAKAPLFLSGESFAGHYLPALAISIQMNTAYPLAGVALGNPCVANAAVQDGYLSYGIANSLFSPAYARTARDPVRRCKQLGAACAAFGGDVCLTANGFCSSTVLETMLGQPGLVGKNYYNIARACEAPSDCYASISKLLEGYVNGQKAKWGTPATWAYAGCGDAPYYALQGDLERSYDGLIPPLLEEGVSVLVYSGRNDFLCNWHGNQAWVDSLMWSRAGEWAAAPTSRWRAGAASNAGTVKQVGPLALITVNNAGHMVPMDKPAVALEMIRAFLSKAAYTRENGTVSVLKDGKVVTV